MLDQLTRRESRAVARKPRDAAAVRCGVKFADIHYIYIYKFKGPFLVLDRPVRVAKLQNACSQ